MAAQQTFTVSSTYSVNISKTHFVHQLAHLWIELCIKNAYYISSCSKHVSIFAGFLHIRRQQLTAMMSTLAMSFRNVCIVN